MDGSQGTASQRPLEREVAQLLVETLQLEVTAQQIDPEAPLFGDGLGLDSIDALEMSLAIAQKYGVELRSDDQRNRQILGSLRSLCDHLAAQRSR